MGWYPAEACWVTARTNYQPTMIAEFTLNQAKRNQIRITLGVSETTQETPGTTWYPSWVLSYAGGAWAFDGGTTAVDGTFYMDFTDIFPGAETSKRYHLGVRDSAGGSVTELKAYKIIHVANQDAEKSCTMTPMTADGQQVYAWIDYPEGNTPPTAVADAAPKLGDAPLDVAFDGSGSSDAEGPIALFEWDFGDGTNGEGDKPVHTYLVPGVYTAILTVTDGDGATDIDSVTIEVTDPTFIAAPTNLQATVDLQQVTLTWTDNSDNEEGFYIERGQKVRGKIAWTVVGQVGADVTSWYETVEDGSYVYRVRGFSDTLGKVSDYSNEAQAEVGSKGGGKDKDDGGNNGGGKGGGKKPKA
jgi:PKD repeat protein